MCIAIYKPHGTAPRWDEYKKGHDSNVDGWGFAVVHRGQLVIRQGYSPDPKKSYRQFRRAFGRYSHSQAIIHFRYATHGEKATHNCHPYSITNDLAVIHNGVIDIDCDIDKTKSDTWHFVQHVLRPLHGENPKFFLAKHHAYTNERAQRSSKFCFLSADGSHAIWNQSSGSWEHGHWWSNSQYKCARPAPTKVYNWQPRTTTVGSSRSYTATATSSVSSRLYNTRSSDYYRNLELTYDAQDYNDMVKSVAANKTVSSADTRWDSFDDDAVLELDTEDDGTAVATATSIHSIPVSDQLIVAPSGRSRLFDEYKSYAAETAAEYVEQELLYLGLSSDTIEDIIDTFGYESLVKIGLALGVHETSIRGSMR